MDAHMTMDEVRYTAQDIGLLQSIVLWPLTIRVYEVIHARLGQELLAMDLVTAKIVGPYIILKPTEAGKALIESLTIEAKQVIGPQASAYDLAQWREDKSQAIQMQKDREDAVKEGYEQGLEDAQGLIALIRKIDMNSISPMDAMTKLYELKRMIPR